MKPQRLFTPFAFVLLGCTPMVMQVPPGVRGNPELKVTGYSGNVVTFRQKDITLGSYKVTNIDRDWDKSSSVNAGAFSSQSQEKAFRFDVLSQGHNLHGECNEQAAAQSVGPFGKAMIRFACTCTEGEQNRVSLELMNGSGTARIGDAISYDVTSVYMTDQGRLQSETLGYDFKGPNGEGAIDKTGSGRAWLPTNASEDEVLGLVCSYAGFFLYRPTN